MKEATSLTPGIMLSEEDWKQGVSLVVTPPQGREVVTNGTVQSGDLAWNKVENEWQSLSPSSTAVGHPCKDFWAIARSKVEHYRPKVCLANIMVTAANDCRSPAITMAFQYAINSLNRIAERACEIKDEVILAELEHLDFVKRESDVRDQPA